MLSNWIYEVADLFLSAEKSAALLTHDGDLLHTKSDLPFEITGFKHLAENSLKYIPLKAGDVMITNDSYSGGSFLHRYSFLMPLRPADGAHPGLLLCVRREFSPGLNICRVLDEEGLRIPPTPILQNGQLMTPIIEAMSLHPCCPKDFKTWLQATVSELGELRRKWLSAEKSCRLQFSSAEIKRYLQFSQKHVTEKILEKAPGDARAEVRLDSGEVLKLHLEIHDGLIKADFSGSSPGFKTHVPDVATFGACYEALSNFYDLKMFSNSGGFSCLQVTKPLGCFLNAKYPSSTHQGLRTGVAAVQLAMNMALHQIVKSPQPLRSESDLKIEMAFADGPRWLSKWSLKSSCEALSVEKIESQYPLRFLKLEKDPEKFQLNLEFKTLAPCQIRWLTDFTLNPPRAPRGFKAPLPNLFERLNDQGEWIALPSQGSTDLPPGSCLRATLHGAFVR